jgi:hypothetical protein
MTNNNPLHLYRSFYSQLQDDAHVLNLRKAASDPNAFENRREAYAMTTLSADLIRANTVKEFQGWTFGYNPFTSMLLEATHNYADIPDFIEMTLRSLVSDMYGWMGIGYWYNAEQYFLTAIGLSLLSNNVQFALQLGINLGVCYLGGGDARNAYRVTSHIIPALIKTKGTTRRAVTIRSLSLIQVGRTPQFEEKFNPDESVYEPIMEIYQFLNQTQKIKQWQDNWSKLLKAVR